MFELVLNRRNGIGEAIRPAVCTGTVVAHDVEDQRIVAARSVLHGIEQSPDFKVRMSNKSCVNLHLSRVEPLLFRRQRIPWGNRRGA